MSGFTKGPWKVGPEAQELICNGKLTRRYIPIYEASFNQPEWAVNEPTDHPHPIIAGVHISEEAEADAHLIAAAPEMYEALVQIRKLAGKIEGKATTQSFEIAEIIANVLKKARGES